MAGARRIVVTGHVQGVFFRAWTREQAEALGVSGWVRNRPDGSVEAVIEGDDGQLDAMEARLREGPDYARVDTLESGPTAAMNLDGFVIRH